MEWSIIISVGSLLLACAVAIVNWVRTAHANSEGTTNLIVELKANLKFVTQQLADISENLIKIEEKIDGTKERTAVLEKDLKTVFKQLDLYQKRLEKVEDTVYGKLK